MLGTAKLSSEGEKNIQHVEFGHQVRQDHSYETTDHMQKPVRRACCSKFLHGRHFPPDSDERDEVYIWTSCSLYAEEVHAYYLLEAKTSAYDAASGSRVDLIFATTYSRVRSSNESGTRASSFQWNCATRYNKDIKETDYTSSSSCGTSIRL